jgi:hypothetical protein
MGPTLKEYGQVGYHFLSPPWLLVPWLFSNFKMSLGLQEICETLPIGSWHSNGHWDLATQGCAPKWSSKFRVCYIIVLNKRITLVLISSICTLLQLSFVKRLLHVCKRHNMSKMNLGYMCEQYLFIHNIYEW